MPPSGEIISKLLGLLYEASASTDPWSAFLAAMSESTGSESCYFLLIDSHGKCNLNLNYGYDPQWVRAYKTHFHEHDVVQSRFAAAKRLHGEWIGTRHSVMPEQDYLRTYIYNEFNRPQNKLHLCAVAVGGLDGGLDGGLGMMRSAAEKPFGKETVALMTMLAPHLRQALNTHRALGLARSENAELQHSVEALNMAVLSLDSTGRVVRMSAAAQAILDLHRGIVLDGGFLRASVTAEQLRLAAIIAGAVATGAGKGEEMAIRRTTDTAPQAGIDPLWTPPPGGAMVISRWRPSRPLRVVVTPFHSGELLLGDQPAALVFFSDPDARTGSRASVLCGLYRLTPTECRLASLITEGRELSVAAEQLKITVDTARFHLKSIFRKTGVNRQAELVRLVCGLPCIQGARRPRIITLGE
jgi:DNA-binding CsgD family transcriptional regulator/PAS domain-containing protein